MKIEVKDNFKEDNLKHCEYPSDSEYFGKKENEDRLKIFIQKDILNSLDAYLSSDLYNELGGVLVGNICINNSGENFIQVENFIIAKHTTSSISRLTFTHETWNTINETLERDCPEKKILGWFHSHPGHTVFLSTYDIFIQENFFDMDYMVAYVFDPTIKERGFYSWKDKKIIGSAGYYIYGKKNKNEFDKFIIGKDIPDFGTEKSIDNFKRKSDTDGFKNYILIGLLLIILLFLIIMIFNYYDLKKNILMKEEYEKSITELRNDTKKLNERIDELIASTGLKENSSLNPGNDNPEGNDELKNNAASDINLIKDSSIANKRYVVKIGDTLDKISMQFYKSMKGVELIMKQNNIKNKEDLRIGQELELPNVSQ